MATPVDHAPRAVYQEENVRENSPVGASIMSTVTKVAKVAIATSGGIVAGYASWVVSVITSYGLYMGSLHGASTALTATINVAAFPASVVISTVVAIKVGKGIYNYFTSAQG